MSPEHQEPHAGAESGVDNLDSFKPLLDWFLFKDRNWKLRDGDDGLFELISRADDVGCEPAIQPGTLNACPVAELDVCCLEEVSQPVQQP